MNEVPCVLVTIPISHYCEKARWALDRAGVRYRERAHLQVFHRFAVRRAGRRHDRPRCSSGAIGSSPTQPTFSRIRLRAPRDRRLFPDDPVTATEARELQRDFDTHLGPHGRRWMYNALRGRRDIAIDTDAPASPPGSAALTAPLYSTASRIIDRFLDVSPATAAESEVVVRTTFDEVAARLSDGRPYLCGERFTAADLTLAALAAPMLMPPEYGVPLPQPEVLPATMAATVRELRAHPAGEHALAMFRKERR